MKHATKKHLQRIVAAIMAVAICSAFLAGCASKPAADNQGDAAGSDVAAGTNNGARPESTANIVTDPVITQVPVATGEKHGNVTMGPDSDKLTYVAFSSLPFESLDILHGNSAYIGYMGALWVDPLVAEDLSREKDFVLICATDYTVDETKKEFTFTIHDNIYDWKGNHITASDMVWAYEYANSVRPNSYVASAEVIDDYTFKVLLKEPYYQGEGHMPFSTFRAISQAEYESNPEAFRDNPVGTGPYKCIAFSSGSEAVFQQTYNYWGDMASRPPHLQANVDVVAFKVMTEEIQIQNALTSGAIQIAGQISASSAEDFTTSPDNIDVYKYNEINPGILMLNCYPGTILGDNKALRECVAYALDIASYGYAASNGTGTFYGTYGLPGIVGYNSSTEGRIHQDLDKAKEKLAEAGYKPGELTLRFMCGAGVSPVSAAVVLQANLAEVGINLELSELDETQYMVSRSAPNLNEWDICGFVAKNNGYINNVFYKLNDNTRYEWGSWCGADDPELHEMMMTALYDPTEENINKVIEANLDRLYYLPSYVGNTFVGAYNKLVPVVTSGSSEVYPAAALFDDDYDIFYEG